MKPLFELLQVKPEPVSRSQRTQLIKEIYELYDSITEKKLRRDENIKRYKVWLRESGLHHSKDMYVVFTRTKHFIRAMKPSGMAYFLSHLKENDDLFYVKSVCKDKSNRNESIGAYVMSLRKCG